MQRNTYFDYSPPLILPNIKGHIDYYPFGSAMNTRSYSSGAYRYGFNGKELDKNEEGMGGGGSTYDYGFRIYNPALGKFLSVDPLSASYPWYTPYQFAGNKPIIAIDLDGLEELCVNDNTSSTEPNTTTQPAAESCNQNGGTGNTQQTYADDFVGPLPEGSIRASESPNMNSVAAGLRNVTITITATKNGVYQCRPYPANLNHDGDANGDGDEDRYEVPVYNVIVTGTDDLGNLITKTYIAIRFAAYSNSSSNPDPDYKIQNKVSTCGLADEQTYKCPKYKDYYETQNRFSPYGGCFVVTGTFYIHAGPNSISEAGWGSAGCVEIIGDFGDFKNFIANISGSTAANTPDKLIELVNAKKLTIKYIEAPRPPVKKISD